MQDPNARRTVDSTTIDLCPAVTVDWVHSDPSKDTSAPCDSPAKHIDTTDPVTKNTSDTSICVSSTDLSASDVLLRNSSSSLESKSATSSIGNGENMRSDLKSKTSARIEGKLLSLQTVCITADDMTYSNAVYVSARDVPFKRPEFVEILPGNGIYRLLESELLPAGCVAINDHHRQFLKHKDYGVSVSLHPVLVPSALQEIDLVFKHKLDVLDTSDASSSFILHDHDSVKFDWMQLALKKAYVIKEGYEFTLRYKQYTVVRAVPSLGRITAETKVRVHGANGTVLSFVKSQDHRVLQIPSPFSFSSFSDSSSSSSSSSSSGGALVSPFSSSTPITVRTNQIKGQETAEMPPWLDIDVDGNEWVFRNLRHVPFHLELKDNTILVSALKGARAPSLDDNDIVVETAFSENELELDTLHSNWMLRVGKICVAYPSRTCSVVFSQTGTVPDISRLGSSVWKIRCESKVLPYLMIDASLYPFVNEKKSQEVYASTRSLPSEYIKRSNAWHTAKKQPYNGVFPPWDFDVNPSVLFHNTDDKTPTPTLTTVKQTDSKTSNQTTVTPYVDQKGASVVDQTSRSCLPDLVTPNSIQNTQDYKDDEDRLLNESMILSSILQKIMTEEKENAQQQEEFTQVLNRLAEERSRIIEIQMTTRVKLSRINIHLKTLRHGKEQKK